MTPKWSLVVTSHFIRRGVQLILGGVDCLSRVFGKCAAKYHWCFVPMCTNTGRRTPDKIFLTVLKDEEKEEVVASCVPRVSCARILFLLL